ncbi:uncharacterized protein LOC108865238, partial [Galendromus occidentalis]|uniref:Uncharacterized protein LOC108865238 n=1 Tax=Galendromus occidentalis TaxID=34638 RepID=A0AAJ7PB71_9ACAR
MAKSTNPGTLPLPTPLPLFPPNRRKKWLEFREDFYDYALSNGIFGQTPEVQLSHFRTALGPQCKSKLRALKVTVANNSVDVIKLAAESNIPSPLLESTVKAWEKEYCGKQNVLVVREKFYACNQGSIDFERFLEKVCELAEDCEFPTEVKDEMIRDRLVLGLDSDRLKDRVIQNDKNDLRSVIEVLRRSSRSLPMISTTAEISGAVKEEAVHKVRGERASRQSAGQSKTEGGKCQFCQYVHRPGQVCPAKDRKCAKCNKFGHFAKACRQSNRVNFIHDEGETSTDYESDENEAFAVMPEQGIRKKKKRVFGNLTLRYQGRDRIVRLQIDSGATVNLLPLQMYKQLRAQGAIAPMKKSSMNLRMYNGDYSRAVGEVSAVLFNNSRSIEVTFQIVDLPEQPLLGASESLALGCIKMGDNVEFVNLVTPMEQENQLENLLREYDDVFKGVGRLPGKVKIQLKDDVVP